MLGWVQSGCPKLLAPLGMLTAGCQSQDMIAWSNEALASNRSVIFRKPEDQLWIVSDGSVKMSGLSATLYVLCNQKLNLAGFFSVKFKHQASWLPCEIEVLFIAATVKHFAPKLIVWTGSKLLNRYAVVSFPPTLT